MRTTRFLALFICCALAACSSEEETPERDESEERSSSSESRSNRHRYGAVSRSSESDRRSVDTDERRNDDDRANARRRDNDDLPGERLQLRPVTPAPSGDAPSDEVPSRNRGRGNASDSVSRDNRDWYHASVRGLPANQVTPTCIPERVRQAYQARSIRADRENSFIVWATAWTKDGGGDGRAVVSYLVLEAIMADNTVVEIYSQHYYNGNEVWGGWFPYNDRQWFKMGMVDENSFEARRLNLPGGDRLEGAVINTGRHTGRDLAAGHIWMKRWPRDKVPAGTVALSVTAYFVATGDCLINVGLDRYRLEDADPEPAQECLVSDTYGAEHGVISVRMETVHFDSSR